MAQFTPHEVSEAFAPGTAHLVTTKLVDFLKPKVEGETRTGEVLNNAQLDEAAGMGTRPGEKGYNYLMSAIRIVLKNHQLVWKRIPKSGYIKCLGAAEGVQCAHSDLKAMSRKAKVASRKLIAISRLASASEIGTINVLLAQQGAVFACASHKRTKQLVGALPKDGATVVDMNKIVAAIEEAQINQIKRLRDGTS